VGRANGGQLDRSAAEHRLAAVLDGWAAGPGPLYRKLSTALRRAIADGGLRPGDLLPSERALAARLVISRVTVVGAYRELRDAGLLVSRHGSGTVVGPGGAGGTGAPPGRSGGPAADGRVPSGQARTLFRRLIRGTGEVISFASAIGGGVPEVAAALDEVTRDDLPALLAGGGYQPAGLPALREAIAGHLTGHGLPTEPAEVLVTTGAHQALVLVGQLYIRPGDTVVVESPSWPPCLDAFRDAGATFRAVPLDGEGIDPTGFATALSGAGGPPALAYLMPTYHNPAGVLMSEIRRRRVVELAARHRVPVVEDNMYQFTGNGPGPVPPPLAVHAHHRPPAAGPGGGLVAEVLSVGSLSKGVWAGLRVGWVRAAAPVVERLAHRKALADLGGPLLDQALAVRLLPALDRIVAGRQAEFTAQLARAEAMLAEWLPEWRWRRPAGGTSVWVELPGTDAAAFAQVALRHGVEVIPGATMDVERRHDGYLRMPVTFPAELLDELGGRLARAWADLRRHGPIGLPATHPQPVV
jgi:DNA-binding transcriptional MocR family regulator